MAGDRLERGRGGAPFDEIFPEELSYIRDRRRVVSGEHEGGGPGRKGDRPPAHGGRSQNEVPDDLFGLALSGGGIRSAVFSLGLMQALHRRGVFRFIDYLSTVSGGGYIGSSISSLMANAFYRRDEDETGPVAFPFAEPKPGTEESVELSHLRNNSNYMAPRGMADVLRGIGVLLRGILLNSLSLFPFLFLISLVVLLLYGQQLADRARWDDQVERIDQLLARYYGDRMDRDPDRRVEPLLDILEAEALLREAEARDRNDLIHRLSGDLTLSGVGNPGARPNTRLITGNGTPSAPFQFLPGVSRKDFARALLAADVLQRVEVIEEVALLARLLEGGGFRQPQATANDGRASPLAQSPEARPGGGGRDPLHDLVGRMRAESMLRPETCDEQLCEFLHERGLAEPTTEPSTCAWAVGARLKRILQALYNGEFLDQEYVRARAEAEWPCDGDGLACRKPFYAYGWYAGRVGELLEDGWYTSHPWPWERVHGEIARLTAYALLVPRAENLREGAVEQDREDFLTFHDMGTGSPNAGELQARLALLYFGQYLDPDWVERVLRVTGLAEGIRAKSPELCFTSEESGSLCPGGVDETLAALEESLGGYPTSQELLASLRAQGLVVDEPPPPRFTPGATLEHLLAALDAGHLLSTESIESPDNDPQRVYTLDWHRTRTGSGFPGDWCGSRTERERAGYPDCQVAGDEAWRELGRALRDPSRWDPLRLTLPFTWMAVRLALGWVLLFPVLLLGYRFTYGFRRRRLTGSANPLAAGRTSDESMLWRDWWERSFGWLLLLVFGVGLVELLPYAVHHFHYLDLGGRSPKSLVLAALSLLVTTLAGPALAFMQRFGRTIALVLVAIAGPLLLLIVFAYTMEHVVYSPPGGPVDTLLGALPGDTELWQLENGGRTLQWGAALLLFAVTAAVSLVLSQLVDINATSMHGLYRDRLASAFLVGLPTGLPNDPGMEPREDLSLHQICPQSPDPSRGSGAPYHLINVALNLQGSDDPMLRGRNADLMTLSRDHIGGRRTGYCTTAEMERLCPHLHLAGAMAVSGAAVSPNMGRFTSRALVVLMSLLNARFALWVPHPERAREYGRSKLLKRIWLRFRTRTPAWLLLRELSSAIDDRGPVIHISDGGHVENTGALELLCRRCKYVLVVDGEADPEMTFEGLATLQRIAQLDLGIRIRIRVDPLRRDAEGVSARQWVPGTIVYGDGPDDVGHLLYVKLSRTGGESTAVAEYRARHRDFPHQSTGDQAFDESQFEAYRELGYRAGTSLLDELLPRTWAEGGEEVSYETFEAAVKAAFEKQPAGEKPTDGDAHDLP